MRHKAQRMVQAINPSFRDALSVSDGIVLRLRQRQRHPQAGIEFPQGASLDRSDPP